MSTLGAAAGALLVGAKITDLSKVDHTLEAIVGVVLAAGGVAGAIFAVARVLAPIQPLRDRKPTSPYKDKLLRAIVTADPVLLSGFGNSLEQFESRYREALEKLREAQLEAYADPSDETRARLGTAQEIVKSLQPVDQYLRDLAIHEHARRRFGHAVVALGLGTAAVIAGAVLFNAAVAAP